MRIAHKRARTGISATAALLLTVGCTAVQSADDLPPAPAVALQLQQPEPGESRLANIRQLTNGGENAEAYWSPDGAKLIFQSTRDGRTCDQQYVMNADGSGLRRVSTGTGKTTCGYFFDDGKRIFFSSTHHVDAACPARPDASQGYVWRIDPFDIYTANADGSNLQRLTHYGTYTTEAILSPDGRRMVFTSLKDGDLELYTMNVDGSDVRRLTNRPGYDGGAWWSPDGTQIVWRAWHPQGEALADYQRLLAQGLVRPNRMELWVMNADGSGQRQVTELGGANFGPSWTPDGKQIIFSSNFPNPRSRNFDLYLVDASLTRAGADKVERVTTHGDFDGFPMFSPDGRKLVWGSNRNQAKVGETNVFVADWR
jgi:TolB protein